MAFQQISINDQVAAYRDKFNSNFSEVQDKFDSITNTNWTVVSAAGGGAVKYRIRNGVCFVVLENVAASTSSWLNLATLPEGFRPDTNNMRAAIAYNGGGTANGEMWVDTDGSVKTYGTNASAFWVGTISYPAS